MLPWFGINASNKHINTRYTSSDKIVKGVDRVYRFVVSVLVFDGCLFINTNDIIGCQDYKGGKVLSLVFLSSFLDCTCTMGGPKPDESKRLAHVAVASASSHQM
jgi:hypothetical protein